MRGGGLFVKLDVDYPDNPKIIAAGEVDPLSEVLYIRGLCLAKRTLSDGIIDPRQFARMGLAEPEKLAQILVDHGLWRRVKSGYKIVGWLDRNHSAKKVQELSEKRARAGRAGGKGGNHSGGDPDE